MAHKFSDQEVRYHLERLQQYDEDLAEFGSRTALCKAKLEELSAKWSGIRGTKELPVSQAKPEAADSPNKDFRSRAQLPHDSTTHIQSVNQTISAYGITQQEYASDLDFDEEKDEKFVMLQFYQKFARKARGNTTKSKFLRYLKKEGCDEMGMKVVADENFSEENLGDFSRVQVQFLCDDS